MRGVSRIVSTALSPCSTHQRGPARHEAQSKTAPLRRYDIRNDRLSANKKGDAGKPHHRPKNEKSGDVGTTTAHGQRDEVDDEARIQDSDTSVQLAGGCYQQRPETVSYDVDGNREGGERLATDPEVHHDVGQSWLEGG